MYQELEDDYMCSGMCNSSLFYFGLDIHNGVPPETCILFFKDYITDESSSFASFSIMGGFVALLMFLVHFAMYCRPLP